MEGRASIFVILSGLCFLPACFPQIYDFVDKPMAWAEAQSYCREKNADLASVGNEYEFVKLLAATSTEYNGHVWIGLRKNNSWIWSLEQEGYYGEGEAEFRMWKSSEPSTNKKHDNCAAMDSSGSWYASRCTYHKMFACYDANGGTVGFSSFIFVAEPRTWKEAQRYCRKHHTDLASVRNQAENDQMMMVLEKQDAWIGLYRGFWKWSDGRPNSFKKWNTEDNEPNANMTSKCVVLYKGWWETRGCQEEFFSVCRTVPVNVAMVKVTIKDSSGNLEDAAEAILQQFRQTLKDHGQSTDIKLTWRKKPDGRIFSLEEKEEQRDQLQC